jgi:hypothetical protein
VRACAGLPIYAQTAVSELSLNEGADMSGRLRRFWWVAALVAVVGVGLGLWLSLSGNSSSGQTLPPPRARVYTPFNACLLTDSAGIAGSQAAPVWAGMQDASLKTSRKVSYLAVSGPDTEANAEAFVNTLVQRKCDLVFAVGDSEVAAAEARAKHFPAQRFVVVGSGASGPAGPASANLAVVPGGSAQQVQAAVAQTVEAAPGQ